MKFLSHLEKSKSFWSILVISLIFFLLRFPSIIEPYWYGDEGIYEVIGQAMHQGRLLYVGVWDNKPPLLYVIFALFNGDQEIIRTTSLIAGIFSTVIFFYLSRKLFRKLSTSIITTSIFTLLFATPYLEGNIANAENFILLPIISAALILYTLSMQQHTSNIKLKSQYSTLFIAGLLLGIAFLFKIVAIFDLTAFLLFFLFIHFPEKLSLSFFKHKSFHTLFLTIYSVFLGFFIPLLVSILFFLSQHALSDFIQAAFFGNVGYVGYGNQFLNIPQGLLILKLVLLATTVFLIFLKRERFSKPTMFIMLWFTFSLFNAFFSQRPYTHYLIVLIPSFSLLIGLLFTIHKNKMRTLLLISILCFLLIIKQNFWINTPKKVIQYYQNSVLFITGHKDVKSYRSFFDSKTPRDYELASFITKYTNASDKVFIWGDNAEIYALSHKLPLNKYTVAYHIRQNETAMNDTQAELLKQQPKFIITLNEAPPIPFHIPFYNLRFVMSGATIYERNF